MSVDDLANALDAMGRANIKILDNSIQAMVRYLEQDLSPEERRLYQDLLRATRNLRSYMAEKYGEPEGN